METEIIAAVLGGRKVLHKVIKKPGNFFGGGDGGSASCRFEEDFEGLEK